VIIPSIDERRWPVGYLSMFIAGCIAGIGLGWFQRRSIWDNVEIGCLHGCLATLGLGAGAVTLLIIIALRMNVWGHYGVLCASFFGTYVGLLFLEYLEGEDRDQSP
jgi:hypothetical protein